MKQYTIIVFLLLNMAFPCVKAEILSFESKEIIAQSTYDASHGNKDKKLSGKDYYKDHKKRDGCENDHRHEGDETWSNLFYDISRDYSADTNTLIFKYDNSKTDWLIVPDAQIEEAFAGAITALNIYNYFVPTFTDFYQGVFEAEISIRVNNEEVLTVFGEWKKKWNYSWYVDPSLKYNDLAKLVKESIENGQNHESPGNGYGHCKGNGHGHGGNKGNGHNKDKDCEEYEYTPPVVDVSVTHTVFLMIIGAVGFYRKKNYIV